MMACVVIQTDKFEKIDADGFSLTGITVSTINKLYIALTRNKGDMFLIKATDFKKHKTAHLA